MNNSISIPSLLGVVFVTLKLCHVITWPWLWVTLPFWAVAAIGLALTAFALAMAALAWVLQRLARR